MSRQHWIDEFFRKRLEQRTFPVEQGEFEEMRALLDKQNGTSSLLQGGRFSRWWLSALIPAAVLFWWASTADSANDRDPQTASVPSGSATDHPGPNPTRVGQKASGSVANDQSQGATLLVPTLPSSENPANADKAVDNERSLAWEAGAVPNSTNADRPSSPVRHRAGKRREEAGAAHPGSKRYPVSNGPKLANDPSVAQEADRLHRTSDALAEHGSDPWKERNADGPMAAMESASIGPQGQRTNSEPFSSGSEGERVPSQQVETIDGGTTDRTIASEPTEALAARRADRADIPSGEVISRGIDALETMSVLVPRSHHPTPAATRQPMQRSLEVIKFLSAGELHAFGAPLNVRTRTSDGASWGPEMGSLFGFEYRVRVKRFTWSTGILYGSYAIRMDQSDTDVRLGFVEIPLLGSFKLLRGRFGVVLQGGFTADLLFNSSGRYPVEEDRRSVGFPEGAFRTANYSWLLRPQATYDLDEHLTISAGPLWKAQLGEVAQTGPLDGARISSSGISIGLSWRLERTTF